MTSVGGAGKLKHFLRVIFCQRTMNIFQTIRERIRNAHPDNLAIALSMARVILFVLLGSLARAAGEMAIAYRYGVSADVDAYLFVLNLIRWPIGVWFSVLTVVLVPLEVRIRHDEGAELSRFRAELLGLTLVFGGALMLLVCLGISLLMQRSWSGLPEATANIASSMVPVLSMLAPLGALISLFSAWLLASGRHINSLLEGVAALVLVVVLLVFPGRDIEPLLWGTLAGFVVHLVSLVIPLHRAHKIDAPRFTRASPKWTLFWKGFGIMLVGQALMSFTSIVDQFFAVRLGAGSVAVLSYTNRILALLLGLGAVAISRATLPVFSQVQSQDNGRFRVVLLWSGLLFLFGWLVAIISWWLAPWAVTLLFERGAFTTQNATAVFETLRYGVAQIPFYFSGLVMASLLASQGRYGGIAVIACLSVVVKMGANFVLTPRLGISGIVLGTAFMYMASMVLSWITIRKHFSG